METVLNICNLNKSYEKGKQKNSVLCNLNLTVNQGEFISLMGKSGCGKSTLLYLIAGIDIPTSGKISVCGKNLTDMNETEKAKMRRTEVGFIFQFYNLVHNINVQDNIMLPLVMDDKKLNQYKEKLNRISELVKIQDKLKKRPYELSGGEQQRVAIARALIASPKLILADEPTGNLDLNNSISIMELFQKIHKEGTTILQVTHSLEMAAFSEKVLYLNSGYIKEKV